MSPFLAHVGGSTIGWIEVMAPVSAAILASRVARGRSRKLLLAATTALLIAVLPPLGRLAEQSVTAHMAQHLLILLVAAPCLGLAMPSVSRRVTRRMRRILVLGVWARSAPLVAGAVHLVVVVAWHLPTTYDAALSSELLHGFEHLTMLGTGAWWWSTLAHHARRSSLGPAELSLWGVASGGAVLGVFLMFAPGPLYGHSEVLDQQVAGALMAGVMGALLAMAGSIAVVTFLRREPRRMHSPRRRHSGGGATMLFIAAITVVVSTPALASANVSSEPDNGAILYQRDCAACHGPLGEGTRRGPPLDTAGEAANHYYLSTGRMPIPEPDSPVRRLPVAYTPEQLEDLIAYAASLGDGPDMPVVRPDEGHVARGGIHYRLHCSACHGASGAGGALAVEGFAPSLMPSTRSDVLAAMAAGPGEMPSFEGVLDAADMADVAAYVAHLQSPPRIGLAVPGGRVGEGLVAGVAILALVVVLRLIGRTR